MSSVFLPSIFVPPDLQLTKYLFPEHIKDFYNWTTKRQVMKYFILAVLVFELRALYLLGRFSATWAIPPVLLALVILEIGSHFFPPGWPGL
jgi:ABC-type uncharacterized transport system permease subunit